MTTTPPPAVVTPIAPLNAPHGFAIEQLTAVLAVRPSDATNVRCAVAAASRLIDPTTRSMIQLRINLLATHDASAMEVSPWRDGVSVEEWSTEAAANDTQPTDIVLREAMIRISAPPSRRRRRRRRRDSKAGNVTQSNPSN